MSKTPEGVVLSRAGGVYRIQVEDEILEASLRGRVKHRSREKVLVGDVVSLARDDSGGYTIESMASRHSILKRRNPGRARGVRAVAANLDQVIVVGSIASPDWNHLMMDRFVVVAQASDLPVVVVVNKADLASDSRNVASVYDRIGYRTLITSVTEGVGIEELGQALHGLTSLFTGPTGVGKSSLLNAIQPGLQLRTGEVSKKSGAGRHTTVSAEMFRLERGGYVVDTPGLRDIGLWGIEPPDVSRAYPEIAEQASGCRFDDCRHLREPGCAVHEAVASGEVSEHRFESYQRLLEEAVEASKTWR